MLKFLRTLPIVLFAVTAAHAQSSVSLDDFDIDSTAPGDTATECAGEQDCTPAEGGEISIENVINLGIIDREEPLVQPAGTATTDDKLSRAITLETIDLGLSDEEIAEEKKQFLSKAQIDAVREALRNAGSDTSKIGVVGREGGPGDTMRQARQIAGELQDSIDLPPEQIEAIGLDDDDAAGIQIVIIPVEPDQ